MCNVSDAATSPFPLQRDRLSTLDAVNATIFRLSGGVPPPLQIPTGMFARFDCHIVNDCPAVD